MSSLAEDLLKSRTVAELRGVVNDLQIDVEKKRSELQSMVGSQYHEFVQSADEINKMREQSKLLDERLAAFWEQKQAVVRNVEQLLGQQSSGRAQQGFRRDLSRVEGDLLQELSPSAIWKNLSECDIYAATVKAVGAHCLLHHNSPFVVSILCDKSRQAIQKIKIPSAATHELASTDFLIETILDDANIFCLDDATDGGDGLVEQKARALASMIVLHKLQLASNALATKVDVVDVFLHCAELRIQELFSTSLRQNQSDVSIESGLLSLVQLLQTIVVDIYMLFVYRLPVNDGQHVHGLVGFFQLQIEREINELFAPSDAPLDVTALDPLVSKQRAKRARNWLHEQNKRVVDECSALLRSLTSATQVAQLQQQVYASCCRTSTVQWKILRSPFIALPAFPAIWSDACADLLVRKSARHQRSLAQGAGREAEQVDTALVLWSTVFRASFLHQVERLLQRACEDVLLESQQRVVAELAALGLTVRLDDKDCATSVSLSAGKACSPQFASAKLFVAAERVRVFFDSSLGELLDDVITPVHRSELQLLRMQSSSDRPQDSTGQALMRALKSNCAQLVGQFLSALRRIAESCRQELQSAGTLAWKESVESSSLRPELSRLLRREFGATPRPVSSYSTRSQAPSVPQNDAISCALLLIGRIAWLLRVRSPATHHALSDTSSKSGSAGEEADGAACFVVSEDQFRSAFEIADTDGDGVVSRVEAAEALQALSLGDSQELTVDAQGALSAVATLSYDEFVLTFGANVFSASGFRAKERFYSALDHVVAFCHAVWAVQVIHSQSASLEQDLRSELGLSLGGESLPQPLLRFKSSWQRRTINLESSESEDAGETKSTEEIALPSRMCVSTSQFMFAVIRATNASLVSVDTLQRCPIQTNKEAHEESEDEAQPWMRTLAGGDGDFSLCVAATQIVNDLAIEHLCNVYRALTTDCAKATGAIVDDIALQIVVDVQSLRGRISDGSTLQAQALDRVIEQAKEAIDPILLEVTATLVLSVVQEIFDRSCMFMFFPRSALSPSGGLKPQGDFSPLVHKPSSDQVIAQLFPKNVGAVPRCALLPIAMPSASKFSLTAKTTADDDDVAFKIVSAAETKPKPVASSMMKWW